MNKKIVPINFKTFALSRILLGYIKKHFIFFSNKEPILFDQMELLRFALKSQQNISDIRINRGNKYILNFVKKYLMQYEFKNQYIMSINDISIIIFNNINNLIYFFDEAFFGKYSIEAVLIKIGNSLLNINFLKKNILLILNLLNQLSFTCMIVFFLIFSYIRQKLIIFIFFLFFLIIQRLINLKNKECQLIDSVLELKKLKNINIQE